jgi:hypothetical protein
MGNSKEKRMGGMGALAGLTSLGMGGMTAMNIAFMGEQMACTTATNIVHGMAELVNGTTGGMAKGGEKLGHCFAQQ